MGRGGGVTRLRGSGCASAAGIRCAPCRPRAGGGDWSQRCGDSGGAGHHNRQHARQPFLSYVRARRDLCAFLLHVPPQAFDDAAALAFRMDLHI